MARKPKAPKAAGQDQGNKHRSPNLAPPWKAGQSGNPGGRPKGKSILREMRAALDQTELLGKALPAGKTARECVAEAILLHVIKGNAGFLKQLLEYTYGRVPFRVEHQTLGDDDGKLPNDVAAKMISEGLKALGEQGGPTR